MEVTKSYSNPIGAKEASDVPFWIIVEFDDIDCRFLTVVSTQLVQEPKSLDQMITGRTVTFCSEGQIKSGVIYSLSSDLAFLERTVMSLAYNQIYGDGKRIVVMTTRGQYLPSFPSAPECHQNNSAALNSQEESQPTAKTSSCASTGQQMETQTAIKEIDSFEKFALRQRFTDKLEQLESDNRQLKSQQTQFIEQLAQASNEQNNLVLLVNDLMKQLGHQPIVPEPNNTQPNQIDLSNSEHFYIIESDELQYQCEVVEINDEDVQHNVTVEHTEEIPATSIVFNTPDLPTPDTSTILFPQEASTPNIGDIKQIVKRRNPGPNSTMPKKPRQSMSQNENQCPNTSANTMVIIGSKGSAVHQSVLNSMKWASHSDVTRKLLCALFTKEVLASHTLTGKPSPAFPDRTCKQQLNPFVVEDIINFVTTRCKVPVSAVRTAITTKCADENKMQRQRKDKELQNQSK